ncbi:MAG: DUF1963 domain-containing protein [Clostridia bacterium]|nr:DUF1963 domain-containing protein [Clostridia bacterium]
MRLQAINKVCEVENSKLFGDVFLPESWLENDLFSPDEYFIAQINLQDLNCEILPKTGYLYFFLEILSPNADKVRAKVRYFDGEPDAYTDFNEGYFDEDETVYALEKSDIGNVIFEQVEGDSVTLLSIPTSLLALFNFDCKFLSFVVSKEQVVEQKFDNCQVRFLK